MARKSYRQRRRYRKGRWSSNIKDINDEQTLTPGQNGTSVDLCLNPYQNNLTVSQQYTVKNIELSVYLETVADYGVEDVQHYIMFVPQGMNLTTNYNLEHPEYILAYYYQGNPINDYNSNSTSGNIGFKLKIKTRMARRLQTGDRIVYFWKARNDSERNIDVRCGGLVRWWTKAN